MIRITMSEAPAETFAVVPLTPERWEDLVLVFGKNRGIQCQCWCMYWRLPRAEFDKAQGAKARKLFHSRVDAGPPPGLLAYVDGEPAGWIQVGPRADVPNWNGPRRVSAPTDECAAGDPAVWAVSCFVTRVGWRRRGISTALLSAAVEFARNGGAQVLEACPVDTEVKRNPISLYHGVASSFRRAGFTEVARRREDRPLMRLAL